MAAAMLGAICPSEGGFCVPKERVCVPQASSAVPMGRGSTSSCWHFLFSDALAHSSSPVPRPRILKVLVKAEAQNPLHGGKKPCQSCWKGPCSCFPKPKCPKPWGEQLAMTAPCNAGLVYQRNESNPCIQRSSAGRGPSSRGSFPKKLND